MQNPRKATIKFSLFFLFLIGGYLCLHLSGAFSHLNPETLQSWIATFEWWAPLVYMGVYTFLSLLLFPGTVLSLAGGLLFGPYLGTLYTIIGATGGAILSYFIAGKLGKDFVIARLKGRFRELYLNSEKQGFKIIFLLRLIPLFPFDVVNYAAGLTSIRWHHFLAATVLGIAPGTFVYSFLGSTLMDLHSPKFLLGIGLLVISFFLPLFYLRRKKQKNVESPKN